MVLTVSIIAVVISLCALLLTARAVSAATTQARAARDQTEIQRAQVALMQEQTQMQRDLVREAVQPYVWADIQPDMQQGVVLQLVVGNSGPTTATNVRVTFDPVLEADEQFPNDIARVQTKLAAGLKSLAPNRVLRWSLGISLKLLSSEDPQVCTVRIEADGPYGALPVYEVQLDISDWREARDAPDGSLHHVRGAIKDLAAAVGGVEKTIRGVIECPGVGHAESVELTAMADATTRHSSGTTASPPKHA